MNYRGHKLVCVLVYARLRVCQRASSDFRRLFTLSHRLLLLAVFVWFGRVLRALTPQRLLRGCAAEPDLAPSVQAAAADSGPRGWRHDGGVRAENARARRAAVGEWVCALRCDFALRRFSRIYIYMLHASVRVDTVQLVLYW